MNRSGTFLQPLSQSSSRASVSRSRLPTSAAVVAIAALTACGSESAAYLSALDHAESLERTGRLKDALVALDTAISETTSVRAKNHARYLEAKYTLLLGDKARASAMLEAVGFANPATEHSADALLFVADLHADEGADEGADGKRHHALETLLSSFGSSGAARVAWKRLLQLEEDRGGVEAALLCARTWQPRLETGELSERVHYSLAELLERSGNLREARAEYDAIASRWPYPAGTFFDDALFRASKIDETLGDYPLAIKDLERLLLHREKSLLMGSYERAYYSPAQLRIGELYETRLHDATRARLAYRQLYEAHPTSTLRATALWNEARVLRAQAAPSCGPLQTLLREFPDSRYVPCALAQCRDLVRPATSHAPDECHDYLTHTSE